MKRMVMVLTVGVVFLALSATVALAAVRYGTAGPDKIWGTSGDDSLYGYGGDDTLEGGYGYDYLSGGYGNDGLYGGETGDRIYGGANDDLVVGGRGRDFLYGGTGNDAIYSNRDGVSDPVSCGTGYDAVVCSPSALFTRSTAGGITSPMPVRTRSVATPS